ncbi:structural molecules [Striga asiatica]|uniref:Structural molecules n=1 Tax=Striga asiatica TaxID=4170 RepID=A0A5A7PWM0_STRAF|nr:structural molecules [Striga asiatica]
MEDLRNNALKEGQYGEWLKAPDGHKWTPVSLSDSRFSPPTEAHRDTEEGTSNKASSSQQGNNHQLIPSHDAFQSPSKSIDANSLISVTKTPTSEEGVDTTHLQIIETSAMELEKGDTLITVEGTQNHKAIYAPSTKLPKTWKRTANKLV